MFKNNIRTIKKPPTTSKLINKAGINKIIMSGRSNNNSINNHSNKILNKNPTAGTNIQVYLRFKGGLKSTSSGGPVQLVDTEPVKDVLLSGSTRYNFDRVLKEDMTQKAIYDQVAAPILDDVLKGICCTIFAYGQTGTGKTFTMEGDLDGGYNAKSGIIPRIINDLFMKLDTLKKTESSLFITVSMVELYNEELHDLLSKSDRPLSLNVYEDKDAGVIVQNLSEISIFSALDGIEEVKRGVQKRMTAATQCNEKSSRSHCIFTITLNAERQSGDSPPEIVKLGRLNLVDLAGSENIKNAGSKQVRAREAASINKSLLTLGRVINCLVDKSPHIPYRESKLTRLLKDSLGGKTKTCIIATISPTQQALDDIKSTLEYASRAKDIINCPSSDTAIRSQKQLIDVLKELEDVNNELRAERKKDSYYVTKKTYEAMQADIVNFKAKSEKFEEELNVMKEELGVEKEKTKSLMVDMKKQQEAKNKENQELKKEVEESKKEVEESKKEKKALEERILFLEQIAMDVEKALKKRFDPPSPITSKKRKHDDDDTDDSGQNKRR